MQHRPCRERYHYAFVCKLKIYMRASAREKEVIQFEIFAVVSRLGQDGSLHRRTGVPHLYLNWQRNVNYRFSLIPHGTSCRVGSDFYADPCVTVSILPRNNLRKLTWRTAQTKCQPSLPIPSYELNMILPSHVPKPHYQSQAKLRRCGVSKELE